MRYFLVKGLMQPLVLTRDASGQALTFHPTRTTWASKLYQYTTSPIQKQWAWVGTKIWMFESYLNGATFAPAAATDPDVQEMPGSPTKQTILTGAKLVAAQTWLDHSDFGFTITDGMTVAQALKALSVALGQSDDAGDPD